ncbi:GTPase/DUF3482 domain-containing protein [Orbaceae bacterium ac157xtp]
MNKKQLNLAVVGHTNVGKTSLLRTLTRDSQLGVISNKPGTTTHIEQITFDLDNQNKIVFYDTPGLEDSIALYDYIQNLNQDDFRRIGVEKLKRFLSSPESSLQFEQEAKVIRQLLQSDIAIYVIDVREPTLPKYNDELAILALGDKPVLAVLNYTATPQKYEEEWKKLLSQVGIHAIVRFDAMFPSINGEERLYQSLSLLVEEAKEILDLWQQKIAQLRQNRIESATQIVAETLVDVTAYRENAKEDIEQVAQKMQNKVRQREQQAIKELLKLYQFSIEQQSLDELPIIEGRFESDLFNPEALKLMGIQLTKGAISGAMLGAGIDLAVGGITLGSAALIGATLGSLTQTARHYGARIKHRLAGFTSMTIDDEVICFLALRLLQLIESLNVRGHANNNPIILEKLNESLWKKGKLPKPLKIARVHSNWSNLNKKWFKTKDPKRQEVINDVAKALTDFH